MSNDIKQILNDLDDIKLATNTGTQVHAMLSRVFINDDKVCGNLDLINHIRAVPGLSKLFGAKSQVEVPIAGILNERFVSRRIDRLLVDKVTQEIWILDYKTDVNKSLFRDKYKMQLQEYASLISQIYPDYKIYTCILWTHDWFFEYL